MRKSLGSQGDAKKLQAKKDKFFWERRKLYTTSKLTSLRLVLADGSKNSLAVNSSTFQKNYLHLIVGISHSFYRLNWQIY